MREGTGAKTMSQFSLLHLSEAVKVLIPQIIPLLPQKRCFKHEKSHDSLLVSLEILRLLHNSPYRKCWFRFVKIHFFPSLPSYTQIYLRLERLGNVLDPYQQHPQRLGQSGTVLAQLRHVLDRTASRGACPPHGPGRPLGPDR